MRGLCKTGDFGSGGRDVPLGLATVDPDVRAADSRASGLSGREEIAEAEPQAVNFAMEGYAIGRQNGWMSANDIRELENMNPIPDEAGGNEYLVNGNMIRIAQAAQNGGEQPGA